MSSSDPQGPKSFPLIIDNLSEDLTIEIYDAFDQIVALPATSASNIQDAPIGRQLRVDLPCGLYVVRGSLGAESKRQIVPVNGETRIDAPIPAWSTSAAYLGAESSHKYYNDPTVAHSRMPTTRVLEAGHPADSWIFLFVRARDRDSYEASRNKLDGVATELFLETPQGTAIPLASHSSIHADGWLAFSARAPAGDYRLHDLGNEPRTTSITLYPCWQTQLFLTFDSRVLHGTLLVTFSRPTRGFLPRDDEVRAVDLGLSVLVSGRGTLPFNARCILWGLKVENPMLGLIAAWVALRDLSAEGELGKEVIANLDGLLPASPDVDVLRLAQARRSGGKIPLWPIRRIPMLQVAARELIAIAAESPEVLPDENLLDEVSPRLYSDSSFTTWRPLDRELPVSLRLGLSSNRLASQFLASPFYRPVDVTRAEPEGILCKLANDKSESEIPPVEDSVAWLANSVAEVIEQQARHICRESTASHLSVLGLAKRAGVTPRAVRQVLQASPLAGVQIALSLSNTPIAPHITDTTDDQVNDVTLYLARTLVAAGASIAYGGDFRKGGYTELLAEVIKSYNQTSTRAPQSLHCYLAAIVEAEVVLEGLPLTVHHLAHSPDVAGDAVIPPPSANDQHPSALYYSDMRRVMAKHTSGRIVLGGQIEPRQPERGPGGYGGRFPGVVEEAWRTLEAEKPLYVAGGFGGAAAMVADLLEGANTPIQLQDKTFATLTAFQENAAAIDNDPYRRQLGLPQGMEALAQLLRDLGQPRLNNDQVSMAWNGLTVAENRTLFRARDPMTITSLVLKGLQHVARK